GGIVGSVELEDHRGLGRERELAGIRAQFPTGDAVQHSGGDVVGGELDFEILFVAIDGPRRIENEEIGAVTSFEVIGVTGVRVIEFKVVAHDGADAGLVGDRTNLANKRLWMRAVREAVAHHVVEIVVVQPQVVIAVLKAGAGGDLREVIILRRNDVQASAAGEAAVAEVEDAAEGHGAVAQDDHHVVEIDPRKAGVVGRVDAEAVKLPGGVVVERGERGDEAGLDVVETRIRGAITGDVVVSRGEAIVVFFCAQDAADGGAIGEDLIVGELLLGETDGLGGVTPGIGPRGALVALRMVGHVFFERGKEQGAAGGDADGVGGHAGVARVALIEDLLHAHDAVAVVVEGGVAGEAAGVEVAKGELEQVVVERLVAGLVERAIKMLGKIVGRLAVVAHVAVFSGESGLGNAGVVSAVRQAADNAAFGVEFALGEALGDDPQVVVGELRLPVVLEEGVVEIEVAAIGADEDLFAKEGADTEGFPEDLVAAGLALEKTRADDAQSLVSLPGALVGVEDLVVDVGET